jgi:hypothetical protein
VLCASLVGSIVLNFVKAFNIKLGLVGVLFQKKVKTLHVTRDIG